jgi:5-methyltetrahydropteroyltriglutamate--homocysteine methyltransferase
MKRSADRILTTHTGSLHRPDDLEELYRKKLAGEAYSEKELDDRLRSGVAEIVDTQLKIGVDVIDDGEFSKVNFLAYAKHRLGGIEHRALGSGPSAQYFNPKMSSVMVTAAVRKKFADFERDSTPAGQFAPPSLVQQWMPLGVAYEKPAMYAVVAPLKYKPAEVQRDIANFKAAVAGRPVVDVFMPVVAPAMFATRHVNEYYKSDEEYYFAVAEAMREEYEAIAAAGFVIQIDDVSLPGAYRYHAEREGAAAYKKWSVLAVEVLNHALRNIPIEKIRYHMCWSSQNAPHTDDPPLTELLDDLLKIKAQGLQIEAANVRHEHEWRVWKDAKFPDDRILMPGVICHATNVIEHPEYVSERIQRFTSALGRERVIAATDCGFRLRIHPQIAWAKLETLVEGARLASRTLWPAVKRGAA